MSTGPPGGKYGDVGPVSGVPLDLLDRKVIIYSPARTASQQGLSNTVWGKGPAWKIEFENTEKWENPLMGWTSTADPLECVARSALAFYTKEEAIAFCKKHGWEYEIWELNERKIDRQKRFAGYGDNFSTKRAGLPDLSTFRSNQQPGSDAGTAPPKPSAANSKKTTASSQKSSTKKS